MAEAGFDASGCGAALAAGSAAVELVRGAPVLEAARLTPAGVADELGGLIPSKLHAAELAADALHRALGAAARAGAIALEPQPGPHARGDERRRGQRRRGPARDRRRRGGSRA